MILIYFLVLSISSSILIEGQKLHDYMTKEHIEELFEVSHDEVHKVEYHTRQLKVKKPYVPSNYRKPSIYVELGENMNLYLEENDNVLFGEKTPIIIAKPKYYRGEVSFDEQYINVLPNLTYYHDRRTRSALVSHQDENNQDLYDGIIGEDTVVRSIPKHIYEKAVPQYLAAKQSAENLKNVNLGNNKYNQFESLKSSKEESNSEFTETAHHVIIKRKASQKPADSHLSELVKYYDDATNAIRGYKNALSQHLPNARSKGPSKTLIGFKASLVNRKVDSFIRISNTTLVRNSVPKETIIQYERDLLLQLEELENTLNKISYDKISKDDRKGLLSDVHSRITNLKKELESLEETVDGEKTTGGMTVYPEILVHSDDLIYKSHVKSHNNGVNYKHDAYRNLALYMAAFYNAVDLRFREFDNPKIRLNIAGIIISETEDAIPYLNKHRVNGTDVRDPTKTLGEAQQFFGMNTNIVNSVDAVVVMTRLPLGEVVNGKINAFTLGIASRGGVCNNLNNIALTRDQGGFSGINTVAHELGHLFGAPHDPEVSKENVTIADYECEWNEGYMMSYVRNNTNLFHWSRCSRDKIGELLRSDYTKCLRNKPDVGAPYLKMLPGKQLSRDDQCRTLLDDKTASAFTEQIHNCTKLHCASPTTSDRKYFAPAPADGSECGDGKICLEGLCLRDPTL